MPQLAKIRLSKTYKAESDEQKQAMAAAKKAGVVELDYVTAMENIRNGNGLYELAPADAGPQGPGPRELEDMSMDELKVMMLQTGVTPQKVMKRDDVIRLIRTKLAAVEIVDEG